jgi:hypothetical protein
LDAWSSLGNPQRPEYQPFWLLVFSEHIDPKDFDLRSADVHAHLLVGGLLYEDLIREVGTWQGISHIRRVYNRWGILHYLFSQERNPFRHSRDVMSHCHALVVPPLESDNLHLLERQILRGRREDRRARARAAARARWSSGPK